MTEAKTLIADIGSQARKASRALARASSRMKNTVLENLRLELLNRHEAVIHANRADIEEARKAGLDEAFIDRLTLNDKAWRTMLAGIDRVKSLDDPIGEVTEIRRRPSGIEVGHMRVPLGVVAMIYESRPNVTIDAAVLAIKSGNAIILRGGSEALRTNGELAGAIRQALVSAGLPAEAVQFIDSPDREIVGELARAREWVDVLIPRGGKGLVARLDKEARVPMIKHLDGICHTYVDRAADLEMARRVVENAKTQRYSPCNTTETLLIHKDVVFDFLPEMARTFYDKGVEMRCDGLSRRIVEENGYCAIDATPEDWVTEYNAPIISIRVVESLDEAIDFINTYGSHHTDAILTEDARAASRFLAEVDSSSVMHNASTRFADGFEYGLGAEIGISTDKLHARGPVGLNGLTSLKYIVLGHGEGRH